MHDFFKKIAEEVFGEYILQQVENVFKVYYEEFLKCKYTKESFSDFYNKYLANMSPSLVSYVKENCCGYSLFSNPFGCIKPGITINEFLHVLHSHIMNNEKNYERVPLLGFKANDNNEQINYRGNINNLLGNQLYTYFPNELDCGITEIVALDSKVMIMIRDLGHALTLDIDPLEDGKVAVHYFIPKLCNIDMINALPGIHQVSPEANIHGGARGYFEAPKEQALSFIFDFLSKVPTDKNMLER